jgi:hypothetical protein
MAMTAGTHGAKRYIEQNLIDGAGAKAANQRFIFRR